jgi:hypothetical protein
MNSIWFHKAYYMFGFLFVCYFIMVCPPPRDSLLPIPRLPFLYNSCGFGVVADADVDYYVWDRHYFIDLLLPLF